MRSKFLKKITASSVEEVKPLDDVYELLDLVDLYSKVMKLPCRYTAPTGVFTTKVVGIHKCFSYGKDYFVFILRVFVPKYGNVHFLATTSTFKNLEEGGESSLSNLLKIMFDSSSVTAIDDLSILNVVGRKCKAKLEHFYDNSEVCIGKFLPFSTSGKTA